MSTPVTPDGGYIYGKFIEVFIDGADLPFQKLQGNLAENFTLQATPWQGGSVQTISLSGVASTSGEFQINGIPNAPAINVTYTAGDTAASILNKASQVLGSDGFVKSAVVNENGALEIQQWPSGSSQEMLTASVTTPSEDFPQPSISNLTNPLPTLDPEDSYEIGVEEVWANGDSLLFVLDTADENYSALQNWNTGFLASTEFQLTSGAINFFDGYTTVSLPQFQVDLIEVSSSYGAGQYYTSLPTTGSAKDVLEFFVADDVWIDDLIFKDGIWAEESPRFVTRVDAGSRTVEFGTFQTMGPIPNNPFDLEDFTPEARALIESKQILDGANQNATLEHLHLMESFEIRELNQTTFDSLGLSAYQPSVFNSWDLWVSVTEGSSTVTVETDTDHGLKDGDYVIFRDGSVAGGQTLGGISYADALLGYFEVDVTDPYLFTFQARQDFSVGQLGIQLTELDYDVQVAFAQTVGDQFFDQIVDAAIESRSGTLEYFIEVGGSVVSVEQGGASFSPVHLERIDNLSFSSGNVMVVDWSPDSMGPFYTTSELIPSNFGLLRLFNTIQIHSPDDTPQGFMVGGDLLSGTMIQGGVGDDQMFVGGSYVPQQYPSVAPPQVQLVNGGSGNDTLIVLGRPSDYSLKSPDRQLLSSGEVIDAEVDAGSGIVTIDRSGVAAFDLSRAPTKGDLLTVSRPGTLEVDGFNVNNFSYEAVVESFTYQQDPLQIEPGVGSWTLSFVLPEGVAFEGWGPEISGVNLSFSSPIDLNATNADGLFSIPFNPSLQGMYYELVGKDVNSFDASSKLLSTVVATTAVELQNVEKIQFVSDWPLGGVPAPVPVPDGIDLGYLPLEPIHVTAFNPSQAMFSNATGTSTRLLDLTALDGKNIEVDAAWDFDEEGPGTGYVYYETGSGTATQSHEVAIGDFSGYIISGSNTAVFGRGDYSELVVVDGVGENLRIILNPVNDPAFDLLAFTGQSQGISIDLSSVDEFGAVAFGNNISTGDTGALSGEVIGARGVIGSSENDFIKGSGQTSFLSGGGGADTVIGGAEDDIIVVGGASTVYAGEGDDTILAGGSSTVTGGGGKDLFVVHSSSDSSKIRITDFDFADDGASRPGRSSSWEDRLAIGLSLSSLTSLGILANGTLEGKSLSPADYSLLRRALDFDVSEVDLSGDGANDAIDVKVTYTPSPVNGAAASAITLASFTADYTPAAGQTINATMIANYYRSLDGWEMQFPGLLDNFDLVTTYQGLDVLNITDESSDTDSNPANGITTGGPDSEFALADDMVMIYVGLERNDVSVVRPDFPPTTPPGETISLFARKDINGDALESNFEGSNANERFVGGKAQDQYRFIKEVFYSDDATVSPDQTFGSDLIIERGSFNPDDASRDSIVAKDLDVEYAVFNRTELSREGAGQSLEISWDDTGAINAGDVSVLRQYAWTTQRFRVEDIVLSDGGVEKTYDLGRVKGRGSELHTFDAKDAILVGRENESDAFEVVAGVSGGGAFDLHLWGLDETDSLAFRDMGALKSFTSSGSIVNQATGYREHHVDFVLEGADASSSDDDFTVSTTFHQMVDDDLDFMTLQIEGDGSNLIAFDDDGDARFELDRQDIVDQTYLGAYLDVAGEAIDVYLANDDAKVSPSIDVDLIGFVEPNEMAASTLEFTEPVRDISVPSVTKLDTTIYDDMNGDGAFNQSEDVAVSHVDILAEVGDTSLVITNPGETSQDKTVSILKFKDEDLTYFSFTDTGSTLSELELSTVA